MNRIDGAIRDRVSHYFVMAARERVLRHNASAAASAEGAKATTSPARHVRPAATSLRGCLPCGSTVAGTDVHTLEQVAA